MHRHSGEAPQSADKHALHSVIRPPFQPHPPHAPRSVYPSSNCQHGASKWAPAAPQDMESSKVRTSRSSLIDTESLIDIAPGLPMRRPPRLSEPNYLNQLNKSPYDTSRPMPVLVANPSIAPLPSAKPAAGISLLVPPVPSSLPSRPACRVMPVLTRPLGSPPTLAGSPPAPRSLLPFVPT